VAGGSVAGGASSVLYRYGRQTMHCARHVGLTQNVALRNGIVFGIMQKRPGGTLVPSSRD
jgi:hypothetical protein